MPMSAAERAKRRTDKMKLDVKFEEYKRKRSLAANNARKRLKI